MTRNIAANAISFIILACSILPASVTAQVQVQVVNAKSGGSQPLSPHSVTFTPGCWFQVDGYVDQWLWANLYLYLDGVQVGNLSTDGYGQIGGSTYVNASATTRDQEVVCYVSSNIGDGSASGYLPGIPDGETSSSDGWDSNTLHRWMQTLSPSDGPYGGRVVTESDSGGGGPDTCHFNGSIYDPFEAITGGTWSVGSDNKWGPDFVGWFSQAVTYYRSQGQAPCGTSFPQDMSIDLNTGAPPAVYTTNVLETGFTEIIVWSRRAGQYAERTWP